MNKCVSPPHPGCYENNPGQTICDRPIVSNTCNEPIVVFFLDRRYCATLVKDPAGSGGCKLVLAPRQSGPQLADPDPRWGPIGIAACRAGQQPVGWNGVGDNFSCQ
jgi:hypothetical protein